MGTFGFSYIGLLFLLMLFIPNMIWAKNLPEAYTTKNENKILLGFERIGQVSVTCIALIFSDFNLQEWSLWTIWLIAAFLIMVLYECWWIRYFKSNKRLEDFYSSFLGFPLAGATLPVIAFFLLSIYGKVLWLGLAVILLGIGHIGIHIQHAREIKDKR